MPRFLTVNANELMPLSNVRRVRIVDDEDRKSLAKLGPRVKAERFHTQIDGVRGKSYAAETLDELARQGVAFVQIDERAFIPAVNILKARNLTAKDRKDFKARTGRDMRSAFKAQVETVAGNILASVPAEPSWSAWINPTGPRRFPKLRLQPNPPHDLIRQFIAAYENRPLMGRFFYA